MPNYPTYKLGEICTIVYGKGFPTKNLKQEGFPVYGANGVIGYNDTYLYEEEQVLISCRGAYSGKINRSPKKCWVTNNSLVIISNTDVCKDYLYYALQSANKEKLVTGTAQPQVTINNANELHIPLPPLPTQRAIVTRIETLFAELDKGVEKLKTAQQQLKVYRQAVLNDCLTKGSEKWEIVKLGDIILNMRNGYGKKPTDNGKYRILRISSVRPMNIDFSDYRNNSTDFADNDKIKPNNLLFTRYNGSKEFVGVCATVPNIEEQYAYPDKIICCTLKCDNQYHSKYLQYYLNQGEALAFIRSKIKTTSGQNGIAGSDLKKVTIFLPPLSTQQRIVQEIETRLSACDEVEKQIAESLQQAEALRQSILQKAFSGELV